MSTAATAATAVAAAAAPIRTREEAQIDLFFIISEIFRGLKTDPRHLFAIKGGAAVALHIQSMGLPLPIALPIPPIKIDDSFPPIDLPFNSDIDTVLYTAAGDDFQKNMQGVCNYVLTLIESSLGKLFKITGETKPFTIFDTSSFGLRTDFKISNRCPYSVTFTGPITTTNIDIKDSLITISYTKDKKVFNLLDIQIPGAAADFTKIKPLLLNLRYKDRVYEVPLASLEHTYEDQLHVAEINTIPERSGKRRARAAALKPLVDAKKTAMNMIMQALQAETERQRAAAAAAAEAERQRAAAAAAAEAERQRAAAAAPQVFRDHISYNSAFPPKSIEYTWVPPERSYYLRKIGPRVFDPAPKYDPVSKSILYQDGILADGRPRWIKENIITGEILEFHYKMSDYTIKKGYAAKALMRDRRSTRRSRAARHRRSTYRRK
jgi:hypothetical protein